MLAQQLFFTSLPVSLHFEGQQQTASWPPATENTGVENVGASKMKGWKSRHQNGPCTYRHFNFPSQMENGYSHENRKYI